MGYPPGPTREVAKKLNLRDINTYQKLHDQFGDIFMLPLGDVPLVVTRSPEHIKSLLGGDGMESFPRCFVVSCLSTERAPTRHKYRPPNVVENVRRMFGRAQIGLDGQVLRHPDQPCLPQCDWCFRPWDHGLVL